MTDDERPPGRGGRPRDHTRDPEILDAVLDVVAEHGYVGMTVDMVAGRARAGKATVYRRWPTKLDLVLNALGRLNRDVADPSALPDTGTLRGDLDAALSESVAEDTARRLAVLAGVSSMGVEQVEVSQRVAEAVVGPWVAANRELLRRAVERGEVPASIDVDALAAVVPSMLVYRACIRHEDVGPGYIASLVHGVLLPAAGVADA